MTQATTTEPPLASADDLAARTGRASTDPELVDALGAASALFRAAARTQLSLVTGDVATLDGDGSRVVLLPHTPVRAVSSVVVDGTTRAATDYEWAADGRLRFGGRVPDRYRSVVVTYDHGYDPVPEAVQAVVLDAAEARLDTGGADVASIAVGGQSVSYVTGTTAPATLAWTRLAAYYRPSHAEP